jgi:hypothetical protein
LDSLYLTDNPNLHFFDAAALFPGSSGQLMKHLGLSNCGLTGIGGESGTSFHGLPALEELYLEENNFGDGIAVDAFNGLASLDKLTLRNSGLLSLPAGVFSGKRRASGVRASEASAKRSSSCLVTDAKPPSLVRTTNKR